VTNEIVVYNTRVTDPFVLSTRGVTWYVARKILNEFRKTDVTIAIPLFCVEIVSSQVSDTIRCRVNRLQLIWRNRAPGINLSLKVESNR